MILDIKIKVVHAAMVEWSSGGITLRKGQNEALKKISSEIGQ
jgi:hypothetical protein